MEGNTLKVWEAQMAVSGDKGKYLEFKDNDLSDDTRHAWCDVQQSPKNQGYHYNRNAETCTLIGESMAKAMIDLNGRQM